MRLKRLFLSSNGKTNKGLLFYCVLWCASFMLASASHGTSKVYMTNGETRVGFTHVLDGRVTIRGEDRLFQFPERAVHRIEHVTGDTSLVGKDDVFLREKPEPLSNNLVFIPKGCEVIILAREGEWVKVEVYGGQRLAQGFLKVEELSDSVLFNPPLLPNMRFKDPPRRLHRTPKDPDKPIEPLVPLDQLSPFFGAARETDFNKLSQRLYGTTPAGVAEQQQKSQEQRQTQSTRDEDIPARSVESATR